MPLQSHSVLGFLGNIFHSQDLSPFTTPIDFSVLL